MRTARMNQKPRIYTISFARVYPLYIAKAEKKGRSKAEVDEIIRWLTGYYTTPVRSATGEAGRLRDLRCGSASAEPFAGVDQGVICGVRVEDIEEPPMQEIRYLDKLIDELAKGKAMEKILRKA